MTLQMEYFIQYICASTTIIITQIQYSDEYNLVTLIPIALFVT